jgi:uncharacterized membrane protein YphA (DoxX/SURF4 family)
VSRLYLGFPTRVSGAGLLLLRTAVGTTLVAQSIAYLADTRDQRVGTLLCCIVVLLSGVSLTIGFLARIGAALAAVLVTAAAFLPMISGSAEMIPNRILGIDLILVTIAVALLGPGSISLDAVFFGRRRVIIPRTVRSPNS